jgi:hypothetical protein
MSMKRAFLVLAAMVGLGTSAFAQTYYYSISQHKFTGGSLNTTDCYSGTAEYRNSPYAINMADKGPLPIGTYRITEVSNTSRRGPFTFTLVPVSGNEMFGRSGFLIHGDTSSGNASTGCIVMRNRSEREKIVVGATLIVTE